MAAKLVELYEGEGVNINVALEDPFCDRPWFLL